MSNAKSLKDWKYKHHGPRIQAKAISYIADRIELYDQFADAMEKEGTMISFTDIIRDCHCNHTNDVSCSTLRRWWSIYENFGELPYAVKAIKKDMKKKYGSMSKAAKINDMELLQLKRIIDEYPNYYLDEIALLFLTQTGKFLHFSTLHRYITKD